MTTPTAPVFKPKTKVNYLNNRDILKEIHLSKNSYCSFRDKDLDHQYDIIVPSVSNINHETILAAKEEKAARFKRETGTPLDLSTIRDTDLVFRVICWTHIPLAPKKVPKSQQKKKKIEDYFDAVDFVDPDAEHNDGLDELLEEAVVNTTYVRLNFPPFEQYRLDDAGQLFLVARSHWKGPLDAGEFSKDHGKMTNKLALMFIKLCERYATRSNWRGYCVDTETQALTNRGWLSEPEITTNDQILSFNGNSMAWSSIKSIYRAPFDGLMHYLSNRGIDALITPGHKMVTERGLVPVEYLKQSDRLVMLGDAENTVNEPAYSDHMVKLLGWILNNGDYANSQQVTIYQSEGPQAVQIRDCLTALKFDFTESKGRKNISFLLNRAASNEVFKILPEKNLSMDLILALSTHQRHMLVDTMIGSDSRARGTNWSYTQKDKTQVDLFQALCAISGYKTNSHLVHHMSFGKPTEFYNVNKFVRNTTNNTSVDYHGGFDNGRKHISLGKVTHPNQPTQPYNGTVWCPETEYGSFVARRNGKVYLTGNTYNEEMRGQALLQLSQIGLQFDEFKSQNPFAYYTAAITNSFTRVLNIEKKNQHIRDDIMEMNNLNPSFTRQMSGSPSIDYDNA